MFRAQRHARVVRHENCHGSEDHEEDTERRETDRHNLIFPGEIAVVFSAGEYDEHGRRNPREVRRTESAHQIHHGREIVPDQRHKSHGHDDHSTNHEIPEARPGEVAKERLPKRGCQVAKDLLVFVIRHLRGLATDGAHHKTHGSADGEHVTIVTNGHGEHDPNEAHPEHGIVLFAKLDAEIFDQIAFQITPDTEREQTQND